MEKILSLSNFITKCKLLDEACRQWCDLISEAQERRDGVGFTEFYNDLCSQKYHEYLTDSNYREDCNYTAVLFDSKNKN